MLYVCGCRDGLVAGGSFAGYLINDFVAQDFNVRFDFLFSYIVFVHRI